MRHYGYCNRRVPFDYGNKAAIILRGKLHPRSGVEGTFDAVGYQSGDDATSQFSIYANGTVRWTNDEFDGATAPYGDSYSAAAILGGSTDLSTNNYTGGGNDYEWRVASLSSASPNPQAVPNGYKWRAPLAASENYMSVSTNFGVDNLEDNTMLVQVRKKGTTQVLDTFSIYMKAESF